MHKARFIAVRNVVLPVMLLTGLTMPPGLLGAILDDDFENDTIGNNPGSPWVVTYDVDVSVSDEQSIIGFYEGETQGVTLTDNITTGPRLDAPITVANNVPLYIQFDYMYREIGANNGFQLLQGTTVGLNMHLTHFNTHDVRVNQGAGFQNVHTGLIPGQWYRYTLSIAPANTAADQFDLRVQTLRGHYVDTNYTGIAFQNNLGAFTDIRFHFNAVVAATREFSIDNVLVTTDANELDFSVFPLPEPSMVNLAALAIFFAMITRRRLVSGPSKSTRS